MRLRLLPSAAFASAAIAVVAAARPGSTRPGSIFLLTDATLVAGYAGVTLFVGTLAFWWLVWPSGRVEHSLARLAWAGLLLVVVSTTAGLVALLAGTGPHTAALRLERPAASLIARIVICAVAAAWLASYVRVSATGSISGVVVVCSLALTIVVARPGKVPVPEIALAELHVMAGAGWVGGLAALAVALIPRRDPAVLHATLGSFSWLSMACVGTLAVTGTAHALMHSGGVAPLMASAYGAALLAKLMAVVGMLGAAAGSHQYVRRLGSLAPPPQVIGLFVGAEFAFGAVALVLTAGLVRASG
jgi:copper transport protein